MTPRSLFTTLFGTGLLTVLPALASVDAQESETIEEVTPQAHESEEPFQEEASFDIPLENLFQEITTLRRQVKTERLARIEAERTLQEVEEQEGAGESPSRDDAIERMEQIVRDLDRSIQDRIEIEIREHSEAEEEPEAPGEVQVAEARVEAARARLEAAEVRTDFAQQHLELFERRVDSQTVAMIELLEARVAVADARAQAAEARATRRGRVPSGASSGARGRRGRGRPWRFQV